MVRDAEVRPDTELEPQRLIKTQRLRQDLSDGLITDDEYHFWVYRGLGLTPCLSCQAPASCRR